MNLIKQVKLKIKKKRNFKTDDNDWEESGGDTQQAARSKPKAAGQRGARAAAGAAAAAGEDRTKGNELKALEVHAAKANIAKNAAYFSMLTGNEETPQIYAYIVSNPTKQSYRELVKFRRRTAYFEYVVQLLQKALTEELSSQELNDWLVEHFCLFCLLLDIFCDLLQNIVFTIIFLVFFS